MGRQKKFRYSQRIGIGHQDLQRKCGQREHSSSLGMVETDSRSINSPKEWSYMGHTQTQNNAKLTLSSTEGTGLRLRRKTEGQKLETQG